jgi:hypothetical protein
MGAHDELIIVEPPFKYNPTNGRFLKGNIPFNEGVPMIEWMDKERIEIVLKCLDKNRISNPNLAGWNKKKIVAIKDNKLCGVFESSNEAMRKTGICGRNIRSVCGGKRKHAGGYQWFLESDNKWCSLIEK